MGSNRRCGENNASIIPAFKENVYRIFSGSTGFGQLKSFVLSTLIVFRCIYKLTGVQLVYPVNWSRVDLNASSDEGLHMYLCINYSDLLTVD